MGGGVGVGSGAGAGGGAAVRGVGASPGDAGISKPPLQLPQVIFRPARSGIWGMGAWQWGQAMVDDMATSAKKKHLSL